jgi:hypothetical protein
MGVQEVTWDEDGSEQLMIIHYFMEIEMLIIT